MDEQRAGVEIVENYIRVRCAIDVDRMWTQCLPFHIEDFSCPQHSPRFQQIRRLINMHVDNPVDKYFETVVPTPKIGSLVLLFDLVHYFGDLGIDLAPFFHEPGDFIVRVHHGGVIPIAEQLSDLR